MENKYFPEFRPQTSVRLDNGGLLLGLGGTPSTDSDGSNFPC